MNICVVSPVHGQAGITTAATFVATAIAATQRKRVCLTHTDFSNMTIDNMFGLAPTTELIKSLTQITKLIENNNIEGAEISYYMQEILTNLFYYTSPSINLTDEEFVDTYKYFMNSLKSFSHTIIDMDSNAKSKIYDTVMAQADIVIIVINHNKHVLDKAIKMKTDIENRGQGKRVSTEKEKTIYFMLNHYDANILQYQKIAKALNIPSNKLLLLHESLWITKCSNKGILLDVIMKALSNDVRVHYFINDMKNICRIIQGKNFIWKEK